MLKKFTDSLSCCLVVSRDFSAMTVSLMDPNRIPQLSNSVCIGANQIRWRNCFLDFVVEQWFGCRATEPGFAGDFGLLCEGNGFTLPLYAWGAALVLMFQPASVMVYHNANIALETGLLQPPFWMKNFACSLSKALSMQVPLLVFTSCRGRWSSGRMLDCHANGRGSSPAYCCSLRQATLPTCATWSGSEGYFMVE